MDEMDFRILRRLQDNAGDTRKIIAHELKISEPTLSKRINALQKEGIIKKFTIAINFSKIGYTFSAITFIRERAQSKTDQLGEILASYPEASHVFRVTGDWDYAVMWLCKDSEELDDSLRKLYTNNVDIDAIKTEVFLRAIKREPNIRNSH